MNRTSLQTIKQIRYSHNSCNELLFNRINTQWYLKCIVEVTRMTRTKTDKCLIWVVGTACEWSLLELHWSEIYMTIHSALAVRRVGNIWGKISAKELEPWLLLTRCRSDHQALSVCSVSIWARESIWNQIPGRAIQSLKGQAMKKFTVPQRAPVGKQGEWINKFGTIIQGYVRHEKWVIFTCM